MVQITLCIYGCMGRLGFVSDMDLSNSEPIYSFNSVEYKVSSVQ